VFSWLALSGAASLLERLGEQPVTIQPIFRELGDFRDVLQREAASLERYVENSGSRQGE
jgi:hypothetical protein